MGLIKAAIGAVGGTFADQWKEFFYCDALEADVLMTKGQKKTTSRTSNTKGNENIISNGSGIAVNDGQCMIIVDQGRVVEFCAEPGEFTYDSSSEPSLFAGNLGTSIVDTFKTMWKRFTYGGDTGKDQRVYYFNTKEIMGNKFGTSVPIPFKVVDTNIGLNIDVSLRCNGLYSYKIVDPILFYTNVCGNVTTEYRRTSIDETLKSNFIDALQPAFGELSLLNIRETDIPRHTLEMKDYVNKALTEEWQKKRGLAVADISFNTISLPEEDRQMIKDLQRTAIMRDPTMAAATLTSAQAQAMKDAANNEGGGGAFMAFAGMNMAQGAGGMNAQNLYAMGQQQQAQQPAAPAVNGWTCSCGATATGNFCPNCGKPKPEPKAAAGEWTCPNCNAKNTGNFCLECGQKKPADGWTCECGTLNKGKFCMNCGKPKPAGALLYKCDKCGWEPEDPTKPPKFCPVCGDPFNDEDAKK